MVSEIILYGRKIPSTCQHMALKLALEERNAYPRVNTLSSDVFPQAPSPLRKAHQQFFKWPSPRPRGERIQ